MDSNAFATQQTQTSATSGSGNAAALRPAGAKAKLHTGNNFLDLLFAHIDTEAEFGLPSLALHKAAGVKAQGQSQTQVQTQTETDTNTNVMPQMHDDLTSIFDSLLHGTTASGADVSDALTVKSDGKLEVSGADSGSKKTALSALIATGLSPEKLTQIVQKLAARLKAKQEAAAQDGNDVTSEAAVAATVQLVPPPVQRATAFFGGSALPGQNSPRGLQSIMSGAANAAAGAMAGQAGVKAGTKAGAAKGGDAGTTGNGETDMDALAAKLNNLMVGAGDSMGDEAPGGGLPDAGKGNAGGFHQILKMMEHAQGPNINFTPAMNVKADVQVNANTAVTSPSLSSFGTLSGDAALGSLFDGSGSWKDIYPESMALAAAGQAHGATLTGPAQFASLVGHAATAGAAHPATQMVASAIVKVAANGESKNFTLRLDPPDLGKVQVDMDFKSKDALKTHIVVEKPETYMMLQRDAHVLEKALTDLGINVAGGGLSFELSHDGSQFSGNGSGNNGTAGGKNVPAVDETETTETTMNWYVDEQTGRTRYSLLA